MISFVMLDSVLVSIFSFVKNCASLISFDDCMLCIFSSVVWYVSTVMVFLENGVIHQKVLYFFRMFVSIVFSDNSSYISLCSVS